MNTTSSSYDQSSSLALGKEPEARRKPRYLRTIFLIYTVLVTLLYLALRNAPFIDIWNTLSQLHLWQIGLLFILNSGVIFAITARWWIIVRADNPSIPFLPLVRYRLSTFGISYFTPGPQVGGEPLQVYNLQRNYGVSFPRATSAVIVDKLIEFLGNSILILAGLSAAIQVGMISTNGTFALGGLIPLAAILTIPLVHLTLLYHGRYPLSSILRPAAPLFGNPAWIRLIIVSKRIGRILHPQTVVCCAGGVFLFLAGAGWNASRIFANDFLPGCPFILYSEPRRVDFCVTGLRFAIARRARCFGGKSGLRFNKHGICTCNRDQLESAHPCPRSHECRSRPAACWKIFSPHQPMSAIRSLIG